MRTPGRINNLTSLGLALLAGAGLTLVVRGVRRLSVRGAVASVVAGALVTAILIEGFGPILRAPVPHRRGAIVVREGRFVYCDLVEIPTQ